MRGTSRTRRAAQGALCLVGAFGLAAGCGGRTPQFGGSCSTPTPCGGDLVGTWEATSACSTGDHVEDECSGAYTVITSLDATGTLDIRDTGTWTSETQGTESASQFLPTDCVLDCLAQEDFISLNPAVTDASCTEESDGCHCRFTMSLDSGSVRSVYTLTSDTTVLVSQSGPAVEYSYCVDGDTLTLETGGIVQRFRRR